mmetsp:Transcript_121308/g.329299  ORF Transcript_121308/g.329299 Transcript_121308/m.329299 type:complete len:244 (+) Transcript_121308:726-1457(+)
MLVHCPRRGQGELLWIRAGYRRDGQHGRECLRLQGVLAAPCLTDGADIHEEAGQNRNVLAQGSVLGRLEAAARRLRRRRLDLLRVRVLFLECCIALVRTWVEGRRLGRPGQALLQCRQELRPLRPHGFWGQYQNLRGDAVHGAVALEGTREHGRMPLDVALLPLLLGARAHDPRGHAAELRSKEHVVLTTCCLQGGTDPVVRRAAAGHVHVRHRGVGHERRVRAGQLRVEALLVGAARCEGGQ